MATEGMDAVFLQLRFDELCPDPTPCRLQYPFGGLPNFPEAYPILLSGSAQSNTSVGESVTGRCSGV